MNDMRAPDFGSIIQHCHPRPFSCYSKLFTRTNSNDNAMFLLFHARAAVVASRAALKWAKASTSKEAEATRQSI